MKSFKKNNESGTLYKFLSKNVKEFNKIYLSLIAVIIIVLGVFVGINITNNSYALFSDSVVGEKTIEVSIATAKTVYTNYSSGAGSISIGSSLETINGYNTDYSSLGSYFLKHNINANGFVESNELCYIANNNLYCLKGGSTDYYEENKNILLASLDSDNCYSLDNGFQCIFQTRFYTAGADGSVRISYASVSCSVSSSGTGLCSRNGP